MGIITDSSGADLLKFGRETIRDFWMDFRTD